MVLVQLAATDVPPCVVGFGCIVFVTHPNKTMDLGPTTGISTFGGVLRGIFRNAKFESDGISGDHHCLAYV